MQNRQNIHDLEFYSTFEMMTTFCIVSTILLASVRQVLSLQSAEIDKPLFPNTLETMTDHPHDHVMKFTIDSYDEADPLFGCYRTANDLRKLIDKISRPILIPEVEDYVLHLRNTIITRRKLDLLVQFLNLPLPKASTATGLKWREIHLSRCSFAQPGTSLAIADEEGYCSIEDGTVLAAALAQRTIRLEITRCHHILEGLLRTPRLEVDEWVLIEVALSESECASLGNLIQRSVQLRRLEITTNYVCDPLVLVRGFANAVHVQTVCLQQDCRNYVGYQGLKQGWNDVLGSLFDCRLKRLYLPRTELEDCHFIVIVQMLPTSQLETLQVDHNSIGSQGIMEFAKQLPRIKCLESINIGHNDWEDTREGRRECRKALAHGMIENYSIQFLMMRYKDRRIDYYPNLNRVGRRILQTFYPVPTGLWPLLLERAGRDSSWRAENNKYQSPPQFIYFFLQSSPMLSI